MTLTSQPGYQIYEYGCHEGNGDDRDRQQLRADRGGMLLGVCQSSSSSATFLAPAG
jgi:hypothetical protein